MDFYLDRNPGNIFRCLDHFIRAVIESVFITLVVRRHGNIVKGKTIVQSTLGDLVFLILLVLRICSINRLVLFLIILQFGLNVVPQ